MIASCCRPIVLLIIQSGIMLLSINGGVSAQDTLRIKGLYIGVGTGLDVGGIIGARLTYWITPHVSGFIGGGWALVDPGYNGGMESKDPIDKQNKFFRERHVWLQWRGKGKREGIAEPDLLRTYDRNGPDAATAAHCELLALFRESADTITGDAGLCGRNKTTS